MDKYRSHPTPVFKKLADVITGKHVHVSLMQYQHLKDPIQKNCTVESEYKERAKGMTNYACYKKVSIC